VRLPDFAVGIHDDVRGIGVDAEQAGDLDVEARGGLGQAAGTPASIEPPTAVTT